MSTIVVNYNTVSTQGKRVLIQKTKKAGVTRGTYSKEKDNTF